ncbi:MAG: hypothetical protein U0637_02545 [Phycisphaerales bacterium]
MPDKDFIPLEPLEPADRRAASLGMPAGGLSGGEGGGVAAGTVEEGVACSGCGYALGGLAVSGQCPECGMAVAQSLQGPMLRFAGPEYLRSLHVGVCLVLASVILAVISFVLPVAGLVAASFFSASARQGVEVAAGLFGMVPTIVGLVGYWLFTTPDPALSMGEQPAAARKVVRAMTLVQIVVAVVQGALTAVRLLLPGVGTGGFFGLFSALLWTAGWAAWLVAFFGVMLYVRWLAMRVPDGQLMERSRMYMWLLPVLLVPGCLVLAGPLVAVVLYVLHMDAVRAALKRAIAYADGVEVGSDAGAASRAVGGR